MIKSLPYWIDLLFFICFLFTIVMFYFSNGKASLLTIMVLIWSALHSILAYIGFYQNTTAMPPRYALILIPATMFVIYGLLPKCQQWFVRARDTKISTCLHSVRLPVEIVLFGLFTHSMIPIEMTFEGLNYDIIMGITAPIIGLLFLKNKVGKQLLLVWNIIGLIFILLILVVALLSAELPFQQFGFEQPNRGINYFPFVLLPATIVPIVIWTHASDIIKLRKEIKASIHY